MVSSYTNYRVVITNYPTEKHSENVHVNTHLLLRLLCKLGSTLQANVLLLLWHGNSTLTPSSSRKHAGSSCSKRRLRFVGMICAGSLASLRLSEQRRIRGGGGGGGGAMGAVAPPPPPPPPPFRISNQNNYY